MQSSRLNVKNRNIIFAGVLIVNLLSAMDSSIVGTITPKIVEDINGFNNFSMIYSAYILTMVLSLSVFGRLTDQYGRKRLYIFGIVIFVLSSSLCGIASSMQMLIVCRALQGIGGGLLTGISPTVVGDIFSYDERPKFQGFLGGVYGLATILGPVIGGFLADFFSWRVAFYINIPFGFVALIIVIRFFPNIVASNFHKKIDYPGILFMMLITMLVMLAFSEAGTNYEWSSPFVVGLFAVVIIMIFIFVFVERHAENQVLPFSILKNSAFTISLISGFVMGMVMYAATMYIPMYLEGVMSFSVTKTGFLLLPMMMILVAANILAGMVVSHKGRFKKVTVTSFVFLSVGAILISIAFFRQLLWLSLFGMAFIGAGLGISYPTFMNIAQISVPRELLGTATYATQLSRNMGGIIGISILSSVINNSMWNRMDQSIYIITKHHFNVKSIINIQILENVSKLNSMQKVFEKIGGKATNSLKMSYVGLLKVALGGALSVSFVIIAVLCVIIMLMLLCFTKEIYLKKQEKQSKQIKRSLHKWKS